MNCLFRSMLASRSSSYSERPSCGAWCRGIGVKMLVHGQQRPLEADACGGGTRVWREFDTARAPGSSRSY
eukprot:1860931-Prymnesium_polylepis.1